MNLIFYYVIIIWPRVSYAAFILYHNGANDPIWFGYFLTRFSGALGNPNSLGISTALFLPILLAFTSGKTRCLLVGSCIYLIALTLSRTAFAMVLLISVLGVGFGVIYLRHLLLLLFGLGLSLLGYTIFAESMDRPAIVERLQYTSLGGRDVIWISVYNSLTDAQFIWGAGSLTFVADTVDNEFLSLLTQFGLVGLLFFLGNLVYLVIIGMNGRSRAQIGWRFSQIGLSVLLFMACITASPFTSLKLSFVVVVLISFCIGLRSNPKIMST